MGKMQTIPRNNTKLETSISDLSGLWTTYVQLHNTTVVKFDRDFITLNSGGWKTTTTKARMNQVSNEYGLGYRVFQKDHEWYVSVGEKTLPFSDNMILKRKDLIALKNARLIAATPDLLEACKLVERAWGGDGVDMSRAVDACLLAIEKARC